MLSALGLTHWMQFEARARLATKLYSLYSAGANERSNEEMRQCVSSIQEKIRDIGVCLYPFEHSYRP